MRFWKEGSLLLPVAAAIPFAFLFFDKPVILAAREFHRTRPFGYSLAAFINPLIDFISHGGPQIVIALCLLIGGIVARHRIQRAGWAMTVGFLAAGILVQILKHLFGRARPRVTDETIFVGPTLQGGYDSFPSGHTTATFCLAYILSTFFPRLRWGFYLIAVLTGMDRVKDLSHFPSDVLTGIVVGTVTGILLVRYLPYPWGSRYIREEEKRNG